MKHVVTHPTPPFSTASGRLEIHQVPAWQDNLVWLIVDTATRAALAVDGPVAQPILDWCEKYNLTFAGILNTHTHMDHVGINHQLKRSGKLDGLRVVGPARAASAVPGITEPVDEGDTVQVGEVTGRVMLTEGHINGHVSYVFEDVLFCGDTLFCAGCGYLFDGPPATMFSSLMRLAELDGNTKVCCAHEYTEDNLRFAWSVEPDNEALAQRIRAAWKLRASGGCTVPSTIEQERATNPFLRPGSPTLKARVAAAMPGVDLSTPAAVFAATRALKDRKDYRQLTDADLPLSD